jgi:hypothetical protein
MNMASEPQLAVGMWIAMMALMMAPGSAAAAAAGLQYFLETHRLPTERMALESGATAGILLASKPAVPRRPKRSATASPASAPAGR